MRRAKQTISLWSRTSSGVGGGRPPPPPYPRPRCWRSLWTGAQRGIIQGAAPGGAIPTPSRREGADALPSLFPRSPASPSSGNERKSSSRNESSASAAPPSPASSAGCFMGTDSSPSLSPLPIDSDEQSPPPRRLSAQLGLSLCIVVIMVDNTMEPVPSASAVFDICAVTTCY